MCSSDFWELDHAVSLQLWQMNGTAEKLWWFILDILTSTSTSNFAVPADVLGWNEYKLIQTHLAIIFTPAWTGVILIDEW